MLEQIINDGDFTLVMLTLIFYVIAIAALMAMSSSYFFEREDNGPYRWWQGFCCHNRAAKK